MSKFFSFRARLTLVPFAAMFSLQNVLRYWLPVLVLIGVIFLASSDRASWQHSSRIIGPIVRWFVPGISDRGFRQVVIAARKGAHFTEYALLTFFLFRAMRGTQGGGAPGWETSRAAAAFLAAVAVAVCDEMYQTIVPHRQGAFVDILIDSLGALFALFMVWLVGRWRRQW